MSFVQLLMIILQNLNFVKNMMKQSSATIFSLERHEEMHSNQHDVKVEVIIRKNTNEFSFQGDVQ